MDPDETQLAGNGASLHASSAIRRLEHYEVVLREDGSLHELGRGAMGVTYKALDTRLHCHVALKVISPALTARDPHARERFLREARAAARLRHPNIAAVFHLGELPGGEAFYAMEFVEGETLQECVRRRGPLPIPLALDLAMEVARALIAASQQGFIHRDLKPANLMLVADRPGSSADPGSGSAAGDARVKVIDFGLAKPAADAGPLTGTGDFLGTPQYASPEQFDAGDAPPDARSDIYSLGATLWYALTGKLPFAGRTLGELHARKFRPPPVEQLASLQAPAVARLLGAMLAVDRNDRPQTPYALLEALRECRESLAPALAPVPVAAAPRRRPRRWIVGSAVAALALLVAGAAVYRWRLPPAPAAATGAVEPAAAKSIAVLPFKNLSADPANQFFADAVQDEILINLAHVADLKVISRTSVVDYRDPAPGAPRAAPRNLRDIARAVGVAHIVEGSVQRSGNTMRVSAELIDARTDAHVWAERYNRPVDDLFAVQSEIAQAIAGQLRARLSPQEKASMEELPTRDMAAYKLYREAQQKWNDSDVDTKALFDELTGLLRQAIARDPEFARPRVMLTNILAFVHRNGYDPDPGRSAEAVRVEVEEIGRVRPGSGEAHYAAGFYQYYVRKDYESARAEFAQAALSLPNDPTVHQLLGLIARRQNHWELALAEIEKGAALDPANTDVGWKRITILAALRRYAEAHQHLDPMIAAHPSAMWALSRANLKLEETADLQTVRNTLALAPAGFDPEGEITKARFLLALWNRDFPAAERALADTPREEFPGETAVQKFSRSTWRCVLASARGDRAAMQTQAAAGLPWAEARRAERPEDPERLMTLAIHCAAMGRKEDALAYGRQALALCPISKDGYLGPQLALQWARVLLWTGDRATALETLSGLLAQPGGLTYGNLRLSPDWDPLRETASFQKLVAALAPRGRSD